jgi:hypothetical protein
MYKEFTKDTLKVGDQVHRIMWSDRIPGTVVEVSRNGREIKVQEDSAKAKSPDGEKLPIGHQSWEITRNTSGPISTFTWRSRQGRQIGYVPKGVNAPSCMRNSIGKGWTYYYDWSF